METPDASIDLARRTEAVLLQNHVRPLLIGATALAAHGYPRHTEDIDFAVAVSPRILQSLSDQLASGETTSTYALPDPQDPLGGVITVRCPGSLPVQIINFDNPPAGGFPALVRDALARSAPPAEGLPGRVPSAEDLVLFKLYAGGPKSELDILELLTRCPVDLEMLRRAAHSYRMSSQLEGVLSKVMGS
jgi:hypothetical protein